MITMFSPFAKPKIAEKLVAWFLVFLFLYALVDFFAMHGNLLGGIDTNAHLITFHAKNGHSDIVTHHQGLSDPASQNQHSFLLTDSFRDNSLQKRNGYGFGTYNRRSLHPSIDQPRQKESSAVAAKNDKRRGVSRAFCELAYSPWWFGASSSNAV